MACPPPPGLNVGCFYAVGTLLNRMIIDHYPVSSLCVCLPQFQGFRNVSLNPVRSKGH